MKWDSEKENLEKLILEEKLSYEEIGRRYGCSGANIKKQAKNIGINLPKKRKINSSETFNKGKRSNTCLYCGKPITSANEYCNSKCHSDYKYEKYIQDWKDGKEDGLKGMFELSGRIRRYLFEKNNNKCELCGWGEVNKFTNLVPLQVHHIDGNAVNNKEDNLQLLCPNCHTLTENFGSRNTSTRFSTAGDYLKKKRNEALKKAEQEIQLTCGVSEAGI